MSSPTNPERPSLQKQFWVEDKYATRCYVCGTKFGLLTRKHHCRGCGQVFCSKCLDLVEGRPFGYTTKVLACNECINYLFRRNQTAKQGEGTILEVLPAQHALRTPTTTTGGTGQQPSSQGSPVAMSSLSSFPPSGSPGVVNPPPNASFLGSTNHSMTANSNSFVASLAPISVEGYSSSINMTGGTSTQQQQHKKRISPSHSSLLVAPLVRKSTGDLIGEDKLGMTLESLGNSSQSGDEVEDADYQDTDNNDESEESHMTPPTSPQSVSDRGSSSYVTTQPASIVGHHPHRIKDIDDGGPFFISYAAEELSPLKPKRSRAEEWCDMIHQRAQDFRAKHNMMNNENASIVVGQSLVAGGGYIGVALTPPGYLVTAVGRQRRKKFLSTAGSAKGFTHPQQSYIPNPTNLRFMLATAPEQLNFVTVFPNPALQPNGPTTFSQLEVQQLESRLVMMQNHCTHHLLEYVSTAFEEEGLGIHPDATEVVSLQKVTVTSATTLPDDSTTVRPGGTNLDGSVSELIKSSSYRSMQHASSFHAAGKNYSSSNPPEPNWVNSICELSWDVVTRTVANKFAQITGHVEVLCSPGGGSFGDHEIIDGVTVFRNVTHKKMETKIENPKILLLAGDVGGSFRTSGQMTDLLEYRASYPGWLDKLFDRIRVWGPSVIIVEGGVHHYMQDKILHEKISLLTNVERTILERLEHSCCARIVENLPDIPISEVANEALSPIGQCVLFQVRHLAGETFSVFSGFNCPTFTTVLLRGAPPDYLARCAGILQKSLVAAYHMCLQSHYLLDMDSVLVLRQSGAHHHQEGPSSFSPNSVPSMKSVNLGLCIHSIEEEEGCRLMDLDGCSFDDDDEDRSSNSADEDEDDDEDGENQPGENSNSLENSVEPQQPPANERKEEQKIVKEENAMISSPVLLKATRSYSPADTLSNSVEDNHTVHTATDSCVEVLVEPLLPTSKKVGYRKNHNNRKKEKTIKKSEYSINSSSANESSNACSPLCLWRANHIIVNMVPLNENENELALIMSEDDEATQQLPTVSSPSSGDAANRGGDSNVTDQVPPQPQSERLESSMMTSQQSSVFLPGNVPTSSAAIFNTGGVVVPNANRFIPKPFATMRKRCEYQFYTEYDMTLWEFLNERANEGGGKWYLIHQHKRLVVTVNVNPVPALPRGGQPSGGSNPNAPTRYPKCYTHCTECIDAGGQGISTPVPMTHHSLNISFGALVEMLIYCTEGCLSLCGHELHTKHLYIVFYPIETVQVSTCLRVEHLPVYQLSGPPMLLRGLHHQKQNPFPLEYYSTEEKDLVQQCLNFLRVEGDRCSWGSEVSDVQNNLLSFAYQQHRSDWTTFFVKQVRPLLAKAAIGDQENTAGGGGKGSSANVASSTSKPAAPGVPLSPVTASSPGSAGAYQFPQDKKQRIQQLNTYRSYLGSYLPNLKYIVRFDEPASMIFAALMDSGTDEELRYKHARTFSQSSAENCSSPSNYSPTSNGSPPTGGGPLSGNMNATTTAGSSGINTNSKTNRRKSVANSLVLSSNTVSPQGNKPLQQQSSGSTSPSPSAGLEQQPPPRHNRVLSTDSSCSGYSPIVLKQTTVQPQSAGENSDSTPEITGGEGEQQPPQASQLSFAVDPLVQQPPPGVPSVANISNLLSNPSSGTFSTTGAPPPTSTSVPQQKIWTAEKIRETLDNLVNANKQCKQMTKWQRSFELAEGKKIVEVWMFFPDQFAALRSLYTEGQPELVSGCLARCRPVELEGGRTSSRFFITRDGRFLLKEMQTTELSHFSGTFGQEYFERMKKEYALIFEETLSQIALRKDSTPPPSGSPIETQVENGFVEISQQPRKRSTTRFGGIGGGKNSKGSSIGSLLVKIFGIYRIRQKTSTKNRFGTGQTQDSVYLVMENVFFEQKCDRIYDLKGSQRHRLVTDETSTVLMDTNLVRQANKGNFLYCKERQKRWMENVLSMDSAILSKTKIMDYSLLVGIEPHRKQYNVGIIDYFRSYTIDKKAEHALKELNELMESMLNFAAPREPTVTEPSVYRERFLKWMRIYFCSVPDKS